eukprot:scaffold146748_cov32-Tisochrysis_lutea.AAC.2
MQVPGAQRFDAPVLTGNAWHHGELICPAECAANSGVCYPPLGRCDCPRHRWGPVCEHLVEPAISRTTIFHGWCACMRKPKRAFFACCRAMCSCGKPKLTRRCRGDQPNVECHFRAV